MCSVQSMFAARERASYRVVYPISDESVNQTLDLARTTAAKWQKKLPQECDAIRSSPKMHRARRSIPRPISVSDPLPSSLATT